MRLSTLLVCSLQVFLLATVPVWGQNSKQASPITLDALKTRQQITPGGPKQRIVLQHLSAGQTYEINLPSGAALGGCQPTIALSPSAMTGSQGNSSITFVASGAEMAFDIHYPCSFDWSRSAPTHTVSVRCVSSSSPSQPSIRDLAVPDEVLSVESGTPMQCVQDVLIGGNCFDISNVTFSGSGAQLGTFASGQTNVGFATGVILSTGSIFTAPGPNNADGAGSGVGGGSSDPDLQAIANGSLHDVASLEFEFTPTQSPVIFEYVFASEEYCEYVNAGFNDVFGFFINGPGLPNTNLALLPSGGAVSIDNVNHLVNTPFYVNNQPSSSSNLCGQSASSSPAVNELQFDGYTRKMTCVANVQVCQTYTIKLKIADVGDPIFDSAVFLRAGSFDAGGNASVEWVVDGSTDVEETYEDCGEVGLLFDRIGGNINVPLPVTFTITGTATSGLDFTPIPFTVVIPSGQDQFTLPVNIINDLIPEGQESIIVTLNNPCSCSNPQETLLINDLPPLELPADTVVICGGGVAVLEAWPTGGVEPYTYQWSNSGTEPTTAVFASVSSNYRVTVTDKCGQTIVATFRVQVNPLPSASLLPPAPQICPNGTGGFLTVNFNGTGPFELTYAINGFPQDPIYDITDDPYQLQVMEPGMYTIFSVIDGAGCQGNGLGGQMVNVSTLNMTGVISPIQCAGTSTGAINTTVTGGQGGALYTWSGPQPIGNTIADPTNLMAGTYLVTVTDLAGCTVASQFDVIAPNPLLPTVAGTVGPNCYNPNGGSINLEVSGGFPNYIYHWSNSAVVQDPQGLAAGSYTVTVTDASGCVRTVTAQVVGDNTPPVAVAAAPQELDCQTPTVTITGSGSSVGAQMGYAWTPNPGNIVSGPYTLTPTVNQAGNYTLVVTNAQNGCTSSATVQVNSNSALPVADAGPQQTLTCAINTVTLNGSGSSTGGNYFQYQWVAGPGGSIVGGENTLTPIVSSTGTYTLTVINNDNGCSSTDQVLVVNDLVAPTAAVAPAGMITCSQNQVTLNAAGSSPSNVLYEWTTLNGIILSGHTSSSAVVGEEGDYTVVVTNPQNGCTDDATVEVNVDVNNPTAIVVVNGELNCNTQQLTINGSNSSNGSGFGYEWTTTGGGNIVSGGGTLTPVVNQPGQYTLEITNLSNNCTASASVLVTQNITPPVATAGQPGIINCYNPTLQLGDPNAPILPGVTYQWTASGGGNIVSGNGTPGIVVNEPGNYSILVTNTVNGCSNSSSVAIGENLIAPTAVVAPGGQINCTNNYVQLSGTGSSTGANMQYVWNTLDGAISAGQGTLGPVATAAGTYILLVTDNANGCTASAQTTVISDLNLPDVSIAQPGTITCAVDELTLNGAGSSAGSNFQYQWGTVGGQILSGANSLTPLIGAPGQYTLIVTNSSNNCTAVQSVTVPSDIVPPGIFAGPTQTLSCATPTLTLNGNAPSGSGYTIDWTALAGGNIVSGDGTLTPVIDQPGIYELLVLNTQNGCSSISQVNILQDANDPIVQVAPANSLTCSVQQVTLDASGSSTGGNFVYTWTGPGILSGANSPNPLVGSPGLYTLEIFNMDNSCTSTDTVTVPQNITPPVTNAGADNTLNCYNPQLLIGSTNSSTGPQFVYAWSGPGIVSGGDTPQPVIEQAGTYVLTITNTQNGCVSTDNVSIDANFSTPQADAGPSNELTCLQNFFMLQPTASMGAQYTYAWGTNGGNFVTDPNQLNPTVNGIGFYYITVTNTASGCTATDQTQITQSADFPAANAGIPDELTCATTSLTLDGSASSAGSQFTYLWLPGSGANIVSGSNSLYPVVNEPGTYTLAVTDTTNSCVSYSSVEITQDLIEPVVNAGMAQTLTCSVNYLSLAGSVGSNGNFTYEWGATNGGNILSGAQTLTPSVNAVGTYTLTVTNTLNGCTSSDDVEILADQNAPIVAIASPDTLNCNFNEVTLDATGSSTNNVTYYWTTPNGNFIDLSDSMRVVVNEPGIYQLQVIDEGNNCQSLAAVEVFENTIPPMAQAGSDGLITCSDIITQLDGGGSSQNGNYFYQWFTPDGTIIAGANSLTPTVSAAGSYLLTVLNTDNGCSSEDLAVVVADQAPPVASITIPALITCFSPEVILDGTGSSIGSTISYAWTTPNGNILSGEEDLQAVVNAPGQYSLTVLNAQNGCSSSNSTEVTQNTVPPSIQILPPATLTCSNTDVQVVAIASQGSQFVYGWTTVDGHIINGANSLNMMVDQPGNYSLLVVNTLNGCAALEDVNVIEVTEHPEEFFFYFDPPGCSDNNGFVRIDSVVGGVGPYLYSINGGVTFTTTPAFGNLPPGGYELVVQDVNGCETTQDLDIPEAPDPGIDVLPRIELTFGDSVTLQAVLPPNYPIELIDTVVWTPMDGLYFSGTSVPELLSPGVRPFHSQNYQVTLYSADGCQASDRILVVLYNEPHIYIPNAFSPWETDNNNDIFMIFADQQRVQVRQVNYFRIFDRWGDMVFQDVNFQPNDPGHSWNGRIGNKGKILDPAVFVYVAEIELVDGTTVIFEGDVTLVK